MEFLGEGGVAAPRLKDAGLSKPRMRQAYTGAAPACCLPAPVNACLSDSQLHCQEEVKVWFDRSRCLLPAHRWRRDGGDGAPPVPKVPPGAC